MTDIMELNALGPSGAYRSLNLHRVLSVRDDHVGNLSLVTSPYVSRAMAALRRAPSSSRAERTMRLQRAADIFEFSPVCGVALDQHEKRVAAVSGLPLNVITEADRKIVEHLRDAGAHIAYARPSGSVEDANSIAGDGALWARRGDVFAVLAAGNHPAVHASWIQALALGFRVAIRPSRREPLTPYRLVAALRVAGFADSEVMFLPTDHAAADTMLKDADLSMVYGGDAVMEKYAGSATIYPQGPGRSKILITREVDWRDHLDVVIDSISRGGGTGCTNATAILIEGDHLALASAVASRLLSLNGAAPEDASAQLPVQGIEDARALDARMRALASGPGTTTVSDGNLVMTLPDGSAAIKPAVYALDQASDRRLGAEMPFPCVWIAPWERASGIDALKGSLVVTAITTDETVFDTLLWERTIRNVYWGDVPTYQTAPCIPHDDFLASFLMESRGVVIRREPNKVDDQ